MFFGSVSQRISEEIHKLIVASANDFGEDIMPRRRRGEPSSSTVPGTSGFPWLKRIRFVDDQCDTTVVASFTRRRRLTIRAGKSDEKSRRYS
ncbi:Hypothetical protein CINCED_3A009934 [Cinara cedri]|uniref:Uncharacterized protein n=1 Tax=Cinara cedri TaxID=506608 RepID=A0A5E4LYN8_9HEMI|nr:Hypothetical protein CINCED_3A009934 [Cinara cedri]